MLKLEENCYKFDQNVAISVGSCNSIGHKTCNSEVCSEIAKFWLKRVIIDNQR